MGRHSRGAGEAPAPLPDLPARHPYAPLSAEDTGTRSRFGDGRGDVGEPRYGATRVDLVDPRFGGPAADPAESRSGARREPRYGATRADLAQSRFGGNRDDVQQPRYGATRADLADPGFGGPAADPAQSRFGADPGRSRLRGPAADPAESRFGAGQADSHLPAPGAEPGGLRLGGARRDLGTSRLGGTASRLAAPAAEESAAADRPEPRFGATRADLAEPRSGRRKQRAVPPSDATRADLAESVGSTALAPRAAPDPDEVTDTGARRARSTFRVATEATDAGETATAAKTKATDDHDPHDEHEHETALLLQWGIFLVQTFTGAVAGLGVWLGFYRLWSTWPFYAAPAVGVAAVVMLVLARALRRRHGKDLDLLTAVVTVGVITVLTVLPAAFTLQGLTQ